VGGTGLGQTMRKRAVLGRRDEFVETRSTAADRPGCYSECISTVDYRQGERQGEYQGICKRVIYRCRAPYRSIVR
jgi:hypothetical protein